MTSSTKSGIVDGSAAALGPRLLGGDLHAELHGAGIVGDDLGADPVLERGDDLAARGVVLRVGGEDKQHVERQPHRVAFDLDVALLHDVEEADLHLAAQIRQLVDGEDAAIGAGQQAEVHGELVGEQVPAARGLDRIDVADEVGDGDVRGGELLDEALVPAEPRDRRGVAALASMLAGVLGDRGKRIVVDFAAGDDRDALVEQTGELAQDPALGLAAKPQQDEVVPREQRIDDLRKDGVLVAHDAGEERLAGARAA